MHENYSDNLKEVNMNLVIINMIYEKCMLLWISRNDWEGFLDSNVYICTYVCVCVCIYIYIYTHTHTHIHTGLAKKFLQFLSKNKSRIFHFHQELYWTMYSPFCSTTFCHFSGNFIIPSSQNFLSFWAKNCSRCLLQSSKELKFFPLREFFKDLNKWKSEGADESELPSQAVTVFAWSSKKHAVLRYPHGRLCILCWLIPDAFCQMLLSGGLTGSSTC